MSKIVKDIIRGLQQALAHARGENDGVVVHEVNPESANINIIKKIKSRKTKRKNQNANHKRH